MAFEQIEALAIGGAGRRYDQRTGAGIGNFTPEVAGHLAARLDRFKHRLHLAAQRFGMRTTGVETAARRRFARAWHVAAQQRPRATQIGMADRHGGHQRLGPDRLADDRFDAHARVQRGERVLKNDLQIAAHLTQLVGGQVAQIATFINHVARSGLEQRGGGFVGDDQRRVVGQRHGDHRALAHAAGQLVRPLMAGHALGDLIANGEHRVERGHRLLKDHRHAVATHVQQALIGHAQQRFAQQAGSAGLDGRGVGEQAHKRHGRHAFAAARLPDDGQGFARLDGERHAVDHIGRCILEAHGQRPQVPTHGSGGLGRIAAFNGADDVVVIVAVGAQAVGVAGALTQIAPRRVQADRVEHFEDVQHQPVAGGFGDGAVQCAVPQFDAFGVGFAGVLLVGGALGQAPQDCHLLTAGAQGSQRGQRRLQIDARFHDFAEIGSARQLGKAHRRARRGRADKRTFALPAPDMPFGFKHRQRAANGAAADAEIHRQVALGRQWPLRKRCLLGDHLAQRVEGHLRRCVVRCVGVDAVHLRPSSRGKPEARRLIKQGLANEDECNSDANENWFTGKVRWPGLRPGVIPPQR
nr:hypothetical protein [Tanacetum cinerariifolium]